MNAYWNKEEVTWGKRSQNVPVNERLCHEEKTPFKRQQLWNGHITSIFHGNISNAANTGVNKRRTCDGPCHETERLSTSFDTAIILQLGKLVSDPEYEHHYPEIRKNTDYIVLLTPLTDKRWILIKRVKRTIKMKRKPFLKTLL